MFPLPPQRSPRWPVTAQFDPHFYRNRPDKAAGGAGCGGGKIFWSSLPEQTREKRPRGDTEKAQHVIKQYFHTIYDNIALFRRTVLGGCVGRFFQLFAAPAARPAGGLVGFLRIISRHKFRRENA